MLLNTQKLLNDGGPPEKGGYIMNDDTFDKEQAKFIEDCEIVKNCIKQLNERDRSLVETTGLILGVIALHMKTYGYTHNDFADLLESIIESGWPDDPKPTLKLIKK